MTRFLTLLACGLAVLPASAADPIDLFNGKDTAGWKPRDPNKKSQWRVGSATLKPADPAAFDIGPPGAVAELVNANAAGVDIVTETKYGDCSLSLELMVPKGSNSGVYLMGLYEVQVFDSYGKEKLGPGDLGAIYGVAVPPVNVARKPGVWQTLAVEFVAPKFDGGKKTANAKFTKVVLNGTTIHANVEAPKPTTSALSNEESPTGPLMLQGDHGPVSFRNLKLTPK